RGKFTVWIGPDGHLPYLTIPLTGDRHLISLTIHRHQGTGQAKWLGVACQAALPSARLRRVQSRLLPGGATVPTSAAEVLFAPRVPRWRTSGITPGRARSSAPSQQPNSRS